MDKFGISTALLTPFAEDGTINWSVLGKHARHVLTGGADSVTLFGTTGEGASIGRAERPLGIEALINAGCPRDSIILGVCANSLDDAVDQIHAGTEQGIRDYLLLPPFYFKGCTDDGLFQWHKQLFARTDTQTRFILYNIPQVSGVPLSAELVARLCASVPARIRAIKDSSGDWDNAVELLEQNPTQVLIGDERLLHRAVAMGAGGAISGMANLYPERMQQIVKTASEDVALSSEVARIVSVPVVAALKAVLAERNGEAAWERVRPPLTTLDSDARAMVVEAGEGLV